MEPPFATRRADACNLDAFDQGVLLDEQSPEQGRVVGKVVDALHDPGGKAVGQPQGVVLADREGVHRLKPTNRQIDG
jgi:hypothetical protein